MSPVQSRILLLLCDIFHILLNKFNAYLNFILIYIFFFSDLYHSGSFLQTVGKDRRSCCHTCTSCPAAILVCVPVLPQKCLLMEILRSVNISRTMLLPPNTLLDTVQLLRIHMDIGLDMDLLICHTSFRSHQWPSFLEWLQAFLQRLLQHFRSQDSMGPLYSEYQTFSI